MLLAKLDFITKVIETQINFVFIYGDTEINFKKWPMF